MHCMSFPRLFLLFVMTGIFYLSSCSPINIFQAVGESEVVDYNEIMVNKANLPLYVDVSGYQFGSVLTKASSSDSAWVSLESLLNRSAASVSTFRQYKFKEVPFLSNDSPSYAVLSKNQPDVGDDLMMSPIKIFLVETTDTITDIIEYMVVTMVPDREYMEFMGSNEYSFINKGVFSGMILYSNLDGSFRDVYVYGGDYCPVIDAELIPESDKNNYYRSGYLSVVRHIDTKANDTGGIVPELEASICIADKQDLLKTDDPSLGEYYDITDGWTGDPVNFNGSGGGYAGSGGGGISLPGNSSGDYDDVGEGTASGNVGQSDNDVVSDNQDHIIVDDQLNDDKKLLRVILCSSEGGITEGSGFYQERSFVTLEAIPDTSYVFDRWTGDLNAHSQIVEFPIKSDISSTAYFHSIHGSGPLRPCYDSTRKMYNPLKEMTLAPTGKDLVNIIGATFGKTRNSGTKEHRGLDLYASEGTPVYAMYDGVISKMQAYVIEQPNKKGKNYPVGYTGDTDDAGNRFYLECTIDGNKYYIAYMHLQEGTPIAINPRTGRAFARGDKVYAGELIGYTGRTGNAYNVAYYHLHLGVKNSSGLFINPEDFINGNLQWVDKDHTNIIDRNIINVKCNEEPQNSSIWL